MARDIDVYALYSQQLFDSVPQIAKRLPGMVPTPEQLARRNIVIGKQYDASAGGMDPPIVSLEDFFEGNWDEESLAPNQSGFGRAPLEECYRILLEIRSRPDVQDVLVAIHETPDADEPLDYDIWLAAGDVYVLTSATPDEVAGWSAALKPTEVNEFGDTEACRHGAKPPVAPENLQPGMKVIVLWWD